MKIFHPLIFLLSLSSFKASRYANDGKHDTPRGFPNTYPVLPPPNQISQRLFQVERLTLARKAAVLQKPTTLYMTFGQFLDHDISFTPHATCPEKQ